MRSFFGILQNNLSMKMASSFENIRNMAKLQHNTAFLHPISHKGITNALLSHHHASLKENQLLILKQLHQNVYNYTVKTLHQIGQIMRNKTVSNIAYAFCKIQHSKREKSIMNINSDKSSKLETSDSRKNKIYRRSNDNQSGVSKNKKSYSVDKPSKVENTFIPIKYYPQRKPGGGQNYKSHNQNQEQNKNNSPKLQHITLRAQLGEEEMGIGRNSHNQLSLELNLPDKEQRKEKARTKTVSQRRMNTSLGMSSRDEKIRQLEYLRGKYEKLIEEFNWFSERFLKVIEEEEYVG